MRSRSPRRPLADLRTTVTELTTGLGTLGFATLEEALGSRPDEMVSVAPETWDLLGRAQSGGAHEADFARAFANGRAFLEASSGLRGRRPLVIEWKGSHRAPGDEVAPIDLRIDHVYLVSCKYLSRITINASPANLFDRLLAGAHGQRGGNWYDEVAAPEHARLYEAAAAGVGLASPAAGPAGLAKEDQARLARALATGWPEAAAERYRRLVEVVAEQTARRWRERLGAGSAAEAMLWRILRMGSAPYFLLGAGAEGPLRLRVATPWDWRQRFRLRRFACEAQPGGQPRVAWTAVVEDRHSGELRLVRGHVEVRWSHGRFNGNPEAKVYLDTPHAEIPGYFPIE